MKAYKDERQRHLAIIHTAKKKLGLDDDTYRIFLEAQTGKRSAADLSHTERVKVIAELERLQGRKTWHRPRITLPKEKQPMINKIYALLNGRPVAYAEAILKRMFQDQAPTRLEWATSDQLHKLIAALSIAAKRKDG